MIIHVPTKEKDAGEVCIAARLELDKQLPNIPDKVWYRFPEEYEAMPEVAGNAGYLGKPTGIPPRGR